MQILSAKNDSKNIDIIEKRGYLKQKMKNNLTDDKFDDLIYYK